MAGPWPIRVLDEAQWREFQAMFRGFRDQGVVPAEGLKAWIAERGETVMTFFTEPDGREGYKYACPLCGYVWYGYLGDQPVSGWNQPRWVNTGTLERPTMRPSFGCPNWRAGTCGGHYWVDDGVLRLVN